MDYAILFSDRYREFRRAIRKKGSNGDCGFRNRFRYDFRKCTDSSWILAGYLSSNQLLAQLGKFLGVGAICSLLIVLFVLPGFLYLFDRLFIKKTVGDKKKSEGGVKNEQK